MKFTDKIVTETEAEIKLIPSLRSQVKLRAAMIKGGISGTKIALLDVFNDAGCEFLPAKSKEISDEYWDTPDLLLYKSDRLVRIRTDKDMYIIVKTDARREGDALVRLEREAAITPEERQYEIDTGMETVRKECFPGEYPKFERKLKVTNTRISFMMTRRDEIYEVSLDLFFYTSFYPERISSSYVEIEIEAKGTNARTHIAELSRMLAEKLPSARISFKSKYSKGVEALHLASPLWVQSILAWPNNRYVQVLLVLMALFGFFNTLISLFFR